MLFFVKLVEKDDKTYYVLEKYYKKSKERESFFINQYLARVLVNGGIKAYKFDKDNNRVEVESL